MALFSPKTHNSPTLCGHVVESH
ncbi:hypothetical protein NC651_013706 [Populus alba x Populus x berolinensis]|nr:hypothetical protein NC651_013705 [Populus alba x Populus x berolinensis]KAJ6919850.1 hypothetical protein NC651_013706 [Populus alba x Populus x berolinensis]